MYSLPLLPLLFPPMLIFSRGNYHNHHVEVSINRDRRMVITGSRTRGMYVERHPSGVHGFVWRRIGHVHFFPTEQTNPTHDPPLTAKTIVCLRVCVPNRRAANFRSSDSNDGSNDGWYKRSSAVWLWLSEREKKRAGPRADQLQPPSFQELQQTDRQTDSNRVYLRFW